MHQTPLTIYNSVMGILRDLKDNKVYVDLLYLADLIDFNGLSTTVPRTASGEVSISYGLSLICGMQKYPEVDDFYYLLESIPTAYRSQFIRCWDAIELEVADDIVLWSERAGKDVTVATLRRLAKEIELS